MLDRPPAALLEPVGELIDVRRCSSRAATGSPSGTTSPARPSARASRCRPGGRSTGRPPTCSWPPAPRPSRSPRRSRRAPSRATSRRSRSSSRRRGARERPTRGLGRISAGARWSWRRATTPCAGRSLAQTAVLLHSAARVEEARAFADTHLRDALPAEQEAEVLLGIAGMFACRPTRASPRADRRSRCPSCRRTCAPTTSPRSFTTSSWAAAPRRRRRSGRDGRGGAQRAGMRTRRSRSPSPRPSPPTSTVATHDALELTERRGPRRHRLDRLGARAPRTGVALRDAHRAGPGG